MGITKILQLSVQLMGKTFIGKLIEGLRLLAWTLMLSKQHLAKQRRRIWRSSSRHFYKKKEVYTHGANSWRIKWKHFGHRLLTKIPATLGSQHKGGRLSDSTIQSTIRHKELLNTSFRHHSGTSQNVPDHRQPAALHRRQRSTETTLDIRTLNTGQFWSPKSVYYANPELRSTWGQYQHQS